LELTAAYATFDNEGYGVWPHGIAEIRDDGGTVLYHREGSGPGRVVQPPQVAQMIDLMSGVIQSSYGTGRSARLGRPAAGKTGTGQDFRDASFVGFTAELVTGVWVGNDDNSPMKKVTGGGLPALLWHGFMAAALDGEPARALPMPSAAEIAAVIPGVDAPISEAEATQSDAHSESLEDWLSRVITQRGSRK
ncbi:MAG TPA: penicillin-binding transpeptidase domain-containing protein, partial [Dongiaceae bacterium]|nr:penicillin-binding transpeptidase domain-containing protein [Dongiaceae bacterium]